MLTVTVEDALFDRRTLFARWRCGGRCSSLANPLVA
ncbi:MAG: hypothetical protein ACI8Y4_004876 [Candidatus Poriferisodalaceae bacterium]